MALLTKSFGTTGPTCVSQSRGDRTNLSTSNGPGPIGSGDGGSGDGAVGRCVFPFTYEGSSYSSCTERTRAGRSGVLGWCAWDSTYQPGRWGFCTDGCPSGQGTCAVPCYTPSLVILPLPPHYCCNVLSLGPRYMYRAVLHTAVGCPTPTTALLLQCTPCPKLEPVRMKNSAI